MSQIHFKMYQKKKQIINKLIYLQLFVIINIVFTGLPFIIKRIVK